MNRFAGKVSQVNEPFSDRYSYNLYDVMACEICMTQQMGWLYTV